MIGEDAESPFNPDASHIGLPKSLPDLDPKIKTLEVIRAYLKNQQGQDSSQILFRKSLEDWANWRMQEKLHG